MKDFSMIRELYLGRNGTSEQPMISEEQNRLFDITVAIDKSFRAKFSENVEIMELYDKLADAEAQYSATCSEDAYSHGFRVGVLVGLDVMKVYEDKE